jgi:hypothetical protein
MKSPEQENPEAESRFIVSRRNGVTKNGYVFSHWGDEILWN